MERLHNRVESWFRDQRTKFLKVSWLPLSPHWKMRWPWKNDKEQRKIIQEEYERRRKQLLDLCLAVKADSVSDLQDILCCMVLSECVYKGPSTEIVRAVNKFKTDFGGQVVCLERVQPSSDHVPHRYLLAEAGDTLFASFIGTKQYKDVMVDANILQGAIFHEDAEGTEVTDSIVDEGKKGNAVETKLKQVKAQLKPAAHRGFLARAKGIPALELYRLAQKKKRKLVLCGHSLGGAVAVLATLAILRVIAASSSSKENERVQLKCITFSQPPVGNAALRDYVNRRGWQHYFKTYCIPEDLVPRILSPAYFHHYHSQPLAKPVPSVTEKVKENEGEQQLVLGMGPVQHSLWRLSRLVPLEAIQRQFNKYKGRQSETPSIDDVLAATQSLEIQEGSDGVSLKPFLEKDTVPPSNLSAAEKSDGRSTPMSGNGGGWLRVPYLPSYVPFGQLYLLEDSSVKSLSGAEYSKLKSLSGAEYSKLASVRSMIAELRERFQSHSMRSYRSRFQSIYDRCMGDHALLFLGMEQLQQFPHLQQWLGLSVAGSVELGHIVESPVICTATSIVPLGCTDIPGEKNAEPFKVDITGFGLHQCTVVQAQVNGKWYSTTVESFPSAPTCSSNDGRTPDLQKIRVLVGAPMRRPPKHQMGSDPLMPVFPNLNESEPVTQNKKEVATAYEGQFTCSNGLINNFVIFCTSDFTTVSKEVHVRTRRVKLVGLEGAGKTSLLKAILAQGKPITRISDESLHLEVNVHEGFAGGLCYSDSAGVNLQELNVETSRFRDELWAGIRDIKRKTDMIIVVHNLSHRIPQYSHSDQAQQKPALSFLLDEAKALGIPWVLAITNKFSVSSDQQKAAIDAVLKAYEVSPTAASVINSCPYVMPHTIASNVSIPRSEGEYSDGGLIGQRLILGPVNFVRRPFQKKTNVLNIEGVTSLIQLVHGVLRSHEEASLQELAQDKLTLELAIEHGMAVNPSKNYQAKETSLTAAAVGASVGAGLGIVLAVVMGAASSLRKP